MGLYVNPNEALLTRSLNSAIYIDKSLLIKELNKLINTDHNYICVSRARRFGKTMAGSMIAAYYSKGANSRPLFEKLKISQEPSFEQYLNKFNVIKLDINATYSNSNHDEDKYQGDLLLVGINYDKEAKSHSCTIEKFVK